MKGEVTNENTSTRRETPNGRSHMIAHVKREKIWTIFFNHQSISRHLRLDRAFFGVAVQQKFSFSLAREKRRFNGNSISSCFLVLGYAVIGIGWFIRCLCSNKKRYLESTFCSDYLLSQKFSVLARRLYGRFYERFFVGRELGTGKFDTKMVSHTHSRVINNENTCFEFF